MIVGQGPPLQWHEFVATPMPNEIPNNDPNRPTHKTSRAFRPIADGVHRFEHWYRDNQVYFISARCRDQFPAFAAGRAKSIFWDRFDHWTRNYSFAPWVTSLVDNHYHTVGYLRDGRNLGELMRRLHGSIAKLVNDTLGARLVPFWRGKDAHDYFDGCLRNSIQGCRTYRYVLGQAGRHGLCADWRDYPHTRVDVEMERAIARAMELGAFLEGIPYKRYDG
jgi:hypothetical protein